MAKSPFITLSMLHLSMCPLFGGIVGYLFTDKFQFNSKNLALRDIIQFIRLINYASWLLVLPHRQS